MKIGIIGSGLVAQHLAQGFTDLGHRAAVSSNREEKRASLKEKLPDNIYVGDNATVADGADMIVLAVKGRVAQKVIAELRHLLNNMIIIDATNPIEEAPPVDGVLRYFSNINYALMEVLQEQCPEAHFVKAFNSVGSHLMVSPDLSDKPTMFICGNNEEAKRKVSELIDLCGWQPKDMGTAVAARAIEPLAMLWCLPGFREDKWRHAFKLVE